MKLLKKIIVTVSSLVLFCAYAEEQTLTYQLNELEDDIYKLQSEYVTTSDLLIKDRKKQTSRSMELEVLKDKIRILHFKFKKLEEKLDELEASKTNP